MLFFLALLTEQVLGEIGEEDGLGSLEVLEHK